MTKRQTRLFFYVGTLLFAGIFLALTIDSHRQFGQLTHSDQISDQVIAGKHVWHRKNCVNCHTLLGEGAYYAPDLTRITQQRGEAYLQAFLREPSRFYSEEEDRRLMTNPNLTEGEIADVIAFLDWVSNIDTHGWPPRPILVSGNALPGAYGADRPRTAASADPVAQGEALFRQSPPGCFVCHSTAPGVTLAGPSLAQIGGRAETTIASPTYTGSAQSAEEYIRESIVQPSAHVVDVQAFASQGQSLMPANYAETLTGEQIDHVVAYLMTLR
jgi:nitric oxide reductase subunit C